MSHEDPLRDAFSEEPGYSELPEANIYTVHDRVTSPVARVLLIGRLTSERHSSNDSGALGGGACGKGVEVLRFGFYFSMVEADEK